MDKRPGGTGNFSSHSFNKEQKTCLFYILFHLNQANFVRMVLKCTLTGIQSIRSVY